MRTPAPCCNAIRVVAGGGAYIDPVLAGSLVENVVNRGGNPAGAQPALGELTGRERDVLRLIAWGRSNKEIASAVWHQREDRGVLQGAGCRKAAAAQPH